VSRSIPDRLPAMPYLWAGHLLRSYTKLASCSTFISVSLLEQAHIFLKNKSSISSSARYFS
jgi:hypothetical protein